MRARRSTTVVSRQAENPAGIHLVSCHSTSRAEVILSQHWLFQCLAHAVYGAESRTFALLRVPHRYGRCDGVRPWDTIGVVHLVNCTLSIFTVPKGDHTVVPGAL